MFVYKINAQFGSQRNTHILVDYIIKTHVGPAHIKSYIIGVLYEYMQDKKINDRYVKIESLEIERI